MFYFCFVSGFVVVVVVDDDDDDDDDNDNAVVALFLWLPFLSCLSVRSHLAITVVADFIVENQFASSLLLLLLSFFFRCSCCCCSSC